MKRFFDLFYCILRSKKIFSVKKKKFVIFDCVNSDIVSKILPNNQTINLKNDNDFNTSIKINNFGIKNMNNCRGNLYIYKNLNLNIRDKNKYKNILKEIFT